MVNERGRVAGSGWQNFGEMLPDLCVHLRREPMVFGEIEFSHKKAQRLRCTKKTEEEEEEEEEEGKFLTEVTGGAEITESDLVVLQVMPIPGRSCYFFVYPEDLLAALLLSVFSVISVRETAFLNFTGSISIHPMLKNNTVQKPKIVLDKTPFHSANSRYRAAFLQGLPVVNWNGCPRFGRLRPGFGCGLENGLW